MSENIVKKEIGDLYIWSDNPRYGYGVDAMDEATAINTLIDAVGESKMLVLAKDIVESGGLLGNTLPTIVEKDGRFLVYDGNRRISVIKVLFDPSIIESEAFREKIERLVENKDLSFLNSLNVLLTDEENALRIMDGTHTGERGGAGLIPWDAYNRDISLNSRGQTVLYPLSFAISKILGLKRRKDFKGIQYTDFQRLFSSNSLKTEFGILALDDAHKSNIEAAVTALLAYKDYKRFQSFSREFNTTRDDVDSDLPISRFIAWHRRITDKSAAFRIVFESVELFENDEIPSVNSMIKVIKKDDGLEIDVDSSLLEVSFVNPAGKTCNSINSQFIGDWKCKILYDGCFAEGVIPVRKLEEPLVCFGSTIVEEGSSLSLKKCVSSAISSRRKSMIDSMKIEYRGDGNPSIYNDVLTGETKAGTYTFSFAFDNGGVPYSINHEIIVKPISNVEPSFASSSISPFVDILRVGPFIKLNEIACLAKEINDAWKEGKYRLAVCGMRAILELTLDEISASRKIAIPVGRDLEARLKSFVDELLDISNGLLKGVTSTNRLSFNNETNYLNTLNTGMVVKTLHLAAHKSSTYLNINSIFETCKKDLSHIIALAELLLR